MDLLWFLRDTKICLAYMITDGLLSASSAVGMLLLASRFDGFGGFTHAQLLLMLGYALLVTGVYYLFLMSNNAGAISRVIGRGQLDHALVQPVPLWLHFAAQGFAPVSGSTTLVFGIALTVYALTQLQQAITVGWVLGLVGLVLLSTLILVAWVYAVSALAFWAPYAAEEIAPEVTDLFGSLSPYPLGGLGKLAQLVFCTVLPIGTMAWLPASILLGKTAPGPAAGLIAAVAAVSITLMLLIFRKGLNYYAKHSSPRYSGFGR